MRTATGLFVIGCLLLLTGSMAAAVPRAESSLDPWALTASGMVEGGSATAKRTATLDCPGVHDLYRSYREAAPWRTHPDEFGRIELYDLTTTEIGWLLAFHELPQTRSDIDTSAGPLSYQLEQCTTIHNTGWLPATAGVINAVGDPAGVLDPELVNQITTCGFGDILLASAHFVHNGSAWVFAYGRGVSNDFSGYELTANSSIEFVCQRFFDPTIDVVDLAGAVPDVQVNYNPVVSGLTGLDTWLWYDFTLPATPSQLELVGQVDARGLTLDIVATAWIDQISWDMDCQTDCVFRGMASGFDDSGIDSAVDGGPLTIDFDDTPNQPAVSYDGGRGIEGEAPQAYVYEEKGRYIVSAVTWWRGTFDVSINGVASGLSHLYDPVVVAGDRPYEVVEIRGVLTTPER